MATNQPNAVVRASTMHTWHTSLATTNGGPFHMARTMLVFSLNKMTLCKVGNPNVKWTFSYYKMNERKESPLKKKFSWKQGKVEVISTHTNA